MLSIIMFYLLGQAVNPGIAYWVIFWIFAAGRLGKLVDDIYKARRWKIP